MASDKETSGNLSDLALLETIPGFTLDDLDDIFSSTFNDSFAPSMEPIPEMTPVQMEITLADLFPPTIIAPSIEPIPVIPQQMEISSSLPDQEVDNINSCVVPRVEVTQLDEDNKVHEKVNSKRKYEVWTETEHGLFLEGLKKYDKGNTSKIWKKISEEFVGSKNPRQVGSHAQKFYQRRQKNKEGKRLRPSINDITE